MVNLVSKALRPIFSNSLPIFNSFVNIQSNNISWICVYITTKRRKSQYSISRIIYKKNTSDLVNLHNTPVHKLAQSSNRFVVFYANFIPLIII